MIEFALFLKRPFWDCFCCARGYLDFSRREIGLIKKLVKVLMILHAKVSYIFISREKTSFTQNWAKWSEWVEFAVYFFFRSFKCWWEIKICQCNMFVNFKGLLANNFPPLGSAKKAPLKLFSFILKKTYKRRQFSVVESFIFLTLFDVFSCYALQFGHFLNFSRF